MIADAAISLRAILSTEPEGEVTVSDSPLLLFTFKGVRTSSFIYISSKSGEEFRALSFIIYGRS